MSDTKLEVTIVVDENYLGRMAEVVQNLRSAGMNVKQSMEHLGLIVGLIDPKNMPALSQVEGISHIEQAQQFQLAPPESELQ